MDNTTTIVKFCEIVDDAANWCRKNNKYYPVRKKFFQSKVNLVFYLCRKFKIIHCEEILQKNENIKDKEPYILVKMIFEIGERNFTFYTPKKLIWWKYDAVLNYTVVEIFSKREVNFSPRQIFEICGIMQSLRRIAQLPEFKIRQGMKIHYEQTLQRIESFSSDWRSSDKLRETNNKTGLFS